MKSKIKNVLTAKLITFLFGIENTAKPTQHTAKIQIETEFDKKSDKDREVEVFVDVTLPRSFQVSEGITAPAGFSKFNKDG